MKLTLMSWSGGKDSCVALYELQRSVTHVPKGLLTTVTVDDDRVAMHGVHRDLVARQAEALGLPIEFVPIPAAASNVVYEQALGDALARHRSDGVEAIAFGDLFLADIRRYRETLVARAGVVPLFPVWGRDSRRFMEEFHSAGFRAIVVSVDLSVLDETFAGRMLDADFIASLPPGVDPCGENGEFHSFVFDGPNFANSIDVSVRETSNRDGYCYCEVT